MLMTKKLIAHMLGVTQDIATQGALKLRDAGLIGYEDGRIRVLDRIALEKRSCECHVVVKQEYDRLLPLQLAA
jgi:Mn-dependent DtxR family transcriptional regulator